MLNRISESSNVLQKYRKHPSAGSREITQAMVRSIEEVDKPAKRGKKPETQKAKQVTKQTKGQTPKNRKSNKAAPSQAQRKKQKKPARRLILQSSSDSEYVSASLPYPRNSSSLQSPFTYTSRQAIQQANEKLHANFNDRLTQLEAELAVENRIMDELDRRTSQLKLQTQNLRTAEAELNDLKCHLADKLRPTLNILSRIEGVPVTGVQPKQGGEKVTSQPPPSGSNPSAGPSAGPKGNEASVSNKDKKKKKIGNDDTNNQEDVYVENPKNPF
ncbi:unnamed protein product [Lactuca saligna]|uniref:Uncharacterized protein n=1 Tax=Lactuca saligna TaxID=75948 RepID=A0AA35Z3E6_LACSI|nr:unnamed protein product [Lactuca saligna]